MSLPRALLPVVLAVGAVIVGCGDGAARAPDGVRGGGAVVVPFSDRARDPVAQLTADSVPVVVLYARGVVSPLDAAAISRSRDVGTAGTFDRRLDGRTLSFESAGDARFRDRESGSTWEVTGRAIEGALAGRRLRPVVSDQQFWFALAAFLPDARIVSVSRAGGSPSTPDIPVRPAPSPNGSGSPRRTIDR